MMNKLSFQESIMCTQIADRSMCLVRSVLLLFAWLSIVASPVYSLHISDFESDECCEDLNRVAYNPETQTSYMTVTLGCTEPMYCGTEMDFYQWDWEDEFLGQSNSGAQVVCDNWVEEACCDGKEYTGPPLPNPKFCDPIVNPWTYRYTITATLSALCQTTDAQSLGEEMFVTVGWPNDWVPLLANAFSLGGSYGESLDDAVQFVCPTSAPPCTVITYQGVILATQFKITPPVRTMRRCHYGFINAGGAVHLVDTITNICEEETHQAEGIVEEFRCINWNTTPSCPD